MTDLPRDQSLEAGPAFLREGYRFLPDRFGRLNTDVFEARLMLRRAVCVGGEDAARMFYTPDRFTRRGALPPTTLLSLQDRGSVQTLDGEAHHRRKRLFLSLMTPDHVRRLGDLFEAEWRNRLPTWARMDDVVLLPQARDLLCRAVCRWAGIHLTNAEASCRAREFGAMIDGAGSVGPRNWRGLRLRSRTERWARGLIRETRSGSLRPPPDSPLRAVAFHQDAPGRRLSVNLAAVELLNLLRPTVAVERFVAFAALALHQHPEWRDRLRDADEAVLDAFAQEVRRFYPFFPAVAGRALAPFEWRDLRFARGDWVLLDLYGTDRDPRSWTEPQVFRPERFLEGEANPWNFIPQGGGDDVARSHRCPGEPATVELIKRAARLLVREMRYEVPPQDLTVDLGRMPTCPRSGFRMRNVRPA